MAVSAVNSVPSTTALVSINAAPEIVTQSPNTAAPIVNSNPSTTAPVPLDAETAVVKQRPTKTRWIHLPDVFTQYILSFLRNGETPPLAYTCRAWRYEARKSVNSTEIMQMVGDQTKHYALRSVVKVITDHFGKFRHVWELDLSKLRLAIGNKTSVHLIPALLRSWPSRLVTLTMPRCSADGYVTFQNDVTWGILQAMPKTVTTLDLCVTDPSKFADPFDEIQKEAIDVSRVTTLACSDKSGSAVQALTCCPLLTDLGVELDQHNQTETIAKIINLGKNLQRLAIRGTFNGLITLTPESKDIKISPFLRKPTDSKLRRVELYNCWVDNAVVNFFKRACHPSVQFTFENCRVILDRGSSKINGADLQLP
ncbi:MAG: hypothetical protein ACHQT8_02315 [Chlamydiales bacterium]